MTVPLAQLLTWSAQCTIQHHVSSCNALDNMGGISVAQRTWLTVLATRRETIIIPTANCLGYMQNKRGDAGFDPNRDFSYSRRDDRCFQSASARIFRALMERSIVQTVVTYHGGMVALGYEWGSKNHLKPKDKSPDDVAHRDIALKMKLFGGSFANEKAYPGNF